MQESSKIFFSNHAVNQMFQREISIKEIKEALINGEIIKKYPNDKPYPSNIKLAFSNKRPLHIVYSYNKEEDTFIVITAYEPSKEIWEDDFKTRKK